MAEDLGRFGVNTYGFTQSHTPLGAIAALHAEGFTRFELMAIHGHLWMDAGPETFEALTAFVAEHGIEIVSLNTANIDINIASGTPAMRHYSLDLVADMIRLGGKLGARGFILGPGKPNPLSPLPFDTLEGHFHTALDTLVPLARDNGIALWAENMPFSFLAGADALSDSLDRYGDAGIGICYDVTNAYFIGEDPIKGLERVGERLALVHVSDTTRTVYRHDPIGMGDMDFARLAASIRASRAPDVMLEIIAPDPVEAIVNSARALAEEGY